MDVALIVPAAGSGRRLAADRPKALVEVGGTTLVRRTLERFVDVPEIVEVVVAVPAGALAEFQEALTGIAWEGPEVVITAGGSTRQESVRGAIESLRSSAEIVCIHDAARPLVSRETIDAVLAGAAESGAATAASRPSDSVREDVAEGATRAVDRSRLWLVETPQAFRRDVLDPAHARAKATQLEATDDASLVEACSDHVVTLVETQGINLKVTRPEDLELVRRLVVG